MLDRIGESGNTLVRAGGEVVTITDSLNAGLEVLGRKLGELEAILDERIQPLILAETVRAASDAKASTNAALLLTLIMGAAALLTGAGSAWALSRGIVIPVRTMLRGTEIVGAGTLTH